MSDDDGVVKVGISDDLMVAWDPQAARIARVLVSPGRIEILLLERDEEWVKGALERASWKVPEIVIGCPSR